MINNHVFKRFRALSFHREAIGLSLDHHAAPYFCTPVGAEIIGWLGVDGIHFCFIPSISSDMVFAVSPMPCGERYVVPVASEFRDFLALLLSCGDACFLEQICGIDEACFYEAVAAAADRHPEQEAALNILRSEFGVESKANVYQYVKKVQTDFDYTKIPFSDTYYELLGAAH